MAYKKGSVFLTHSVGLHWPVGGQCVIDHNPDMSQWCQFLCQVFYIIIYKILNGVDDRSSIIDSFYSTKTIKKSF